MPEEEYCPMFKVGASSCGRPMCEKVFEAYQVAGIRLMEVSAPAPFIDEVDVPEMASYAKKYGVELWSFHLPFGGNDLISRPGTDISLAIRRHTERIKRWAAHGVRYFVIHPSGDDPDGTQRAHIEIAKESLATLAEIAHREGAVICVENLPRTCLGNCSDEMLNLLSADDRLRACFDTNHLLKENIIDFVRKLGDKIVTTHVSDYDFINERHWLPGEGRVDWRALIDVLKEVHYSGVWMYEVGPECPNTIFRDHDVELSDLLLNAKELFANQKPTLFSTPHPNPPLGWWP